jgi:hypothetical protein
LHFLDRRSDPTDPFGFSRNNNIFPIGLINLFDRKRATFKGNKAKLSASHLEKNMNGVDSLAEFAC